jgi:sugar diacid utilization regulator
MYPMSAPPPLDAEVDPALRHQLSSIQGLLVLSMLMTESRDADNIVNLASTAVPSLGHCRLCGIYLSGRGWQATEGPCISPQVRTDIEAQFAVLSSAGGALSIPGEPWGWAFSLRSMQGHFGYLAVWAEREPPAAEQFLLRVLGQQTGIGLANAALYARERAAAAELRGANAALARTVAALERSTEIHNRLTRTAVAGDGIEGIARAVHEVTAFPIAVEDMHGNLQAWVGPERPEPYPKRASADRERLLRRALSEGKPVREEDRLVAAASPRLGVVSLLVLVDPEARAGDTELVALEHGATVLAMELARLQSLAEVELRLGRDLLDELLAGTDDDTARSRARALGYDLDRPHRVVLAEGCGPDGEGAEFLDAVRRAARQRGVGSLVAARQDGVVVLADGQQRWDLLRAEVLHRLPGASCRLGIGGVCVRLADFPRSYREAQLALKMQGSSAQQAGITVFDQLGVYRLLSQVEDTAGIDQFVREWLGELLDHDERRRTGLVITLSRYLECGRSYDAAARTLSVHRSTLKYRLQRIKEVSGHDLADPDTLFNLQLATRARQTLLALRDQGAETPPRGGDQ